MEQFRTYDKELNKIILDEKYLFAFSNFDGFTERLLRAELTVDYDYNYELQLKAFSHDKKTSNNSDSITESGKCPRALLSNLQNLLESDYLSLKHNYDFETFSVTDIGAQQYLINLDTTTTHINIVDGLPKEYFQSKVEEILFEFNEYLKDYAEVKYNLWLK